VYADTGDTYNIYFQVYAPQWAKSNKSEIRYIYTRPVSKQCASRLFLSVGMSFSLNCGNECLFVSAFRTRPYRREHVFGVHKGVLHFFVVIFEKSLKPHVPRDVFKRLKTTSNPYPSETLTEIDKIHESAGLHTRPHPVTIRVPVRSILSVPTRIANRYDKRL